MRTATPQKRLRQAKAGQFVTLSGHPQDRRTFTVAGIRDDGYYELSINGLVRVTASPGHEVKEIK